MDKRSSPWFRQPRGAVLGLEARILLRARVVWLVPLLLALLCAGAGWAGLQRLAGQQVAVAQMQGAEQAAIVQARALAEAAAQGTVRLSRFRDPREPGSFSRSTLLAYAVRMPPSAAVLAVGQDDLLPFYFALNADARTKRAATYEYENPQVLLAGRFDLAFVLVLLFPLCLIAIGHGVRTQEVQAGVEHLLAVAAGHTDTLHRRRLLLAVLPCVAVMLLAGWLACLLAGGMQGLPAAGAWTASTLLYAVFWGLLIAAAVRRSTTPAGALQRLAGVWLLVVVLVPGIAAWAVDWMAPLPARTGQVAALREATAAAESGRQPALAALYAAHPDWAAVAQARPEAVAFGERLVVNEMVEAAMQPLDAAVEAAQRRQEQGLAGFALLSPALLLQSQLNRQAGADAARHREFLAQVERYQLALRNHYRPMLFTATGATPGQFERNAAYPRFAYQPFYSPGWTLADGLGWALALLLAAWGAWRAHRHG